MKGEATKRQTDEQQQQRQLLISKATKGAAKGGRREARGKRKKRAAGAFSDPEVVHVRASATRAYSRIRTSGTRKNNRRVALTVLIHVLLADEAAAV